MPFWGPFLGILVWWQRTGAFLLRQVHGLLAWKPHKAFLFVDLLCALFRDSAPDMFALVVLFFCAIAAPISWKKAQFQDSLVWCGWEINFSHDTIQLVSAKLTKLDALIKALLGNRLGRGHACRAPQALHLMQGHALSCLFKFRGVNAPPVPGAPVPWKQCY